MDVTTNDLLEYAYGCEAMNPAPQSMYEEIVGRSTAPDTLSPEEMMADGIMMLNAIRRSCTTLEAAVLDLYYRRPTNKRIEMEVDITINAIADALIAGAKRKMNRFFVRDAIRHWSPHGQPHHPYKWWVSHMGIHESTLFRWTTSKSPKDRSIRYMLDTVYDNAMLVVGDVFCEYLTSEML